MDQTLILKKIEHLERELKILKQVVNHPRKDKIVSLKGALKGIKFTEEDLQEARRYSHSS